MVGSESPSGSGNGKRSRDPIPEDEVYLDNLHSHKRYLSEIMASSLNGLTVGDPLPLPLPHNLMDSPSTIFYLRDDLPLQQYQYSPMSEDSDDSAHPETPRPTSPVSPYRCQKPLIFSSTPTASHSRQRGPSDSEPRFPSSPSDICHSADLRRAALLRSVQMRTHPLTSGPNADLKPLLYHSHSDSDREEEYAIDDCAMTISHHQQNPQD